MVSCRGIRTVCLMACCVMGIVGIYSFVYAKITKQKKDLSAYQWSYVADKRNVIPIVVIGSGPAGLSASMYGARAGIKSVVFEGDEPGGLLTKTGDVENIPAVSRKPGTKIMKKLRKQAKRFGVQCVADIIEEVDFSSWPFKVVTGEGETVYALSVVISTGAAPRLLNIEGETEFWGQGVSACARCDALLYKNREVVVIGGGDSAIEEALQLAPHVKKVTIIHRRDQMRAAPHVIKRIDSYKNITIHYNAQVKKICGNENGVHSVELIDSKTQEHKIIPIDGVFLAIGHEPNTGLFKGQIVTDDHGYIFLEGRTQETNIPGVFAAGDVADSRYRQAGTAAGDGIKAGIDAINFLQEVGFSTSKATQLAENLFHQ